MLSLIYSIFQELNQRAQGEVTIREAIRELDLWGAAAVFTLTEYEDSNKNTIHLIKDWKDLVNQVRSLFSFYSLQTNFGVGFTVFPLSLPQSFCNKDTG